MDASVVVRLEVVWLYYVSDFRVIEFSLDSRNGRQIWLLLPTIASYLLHLDLFALLCGISTIQLYYIREEDRHRINGGRRCTSRNFWISMKICYSTYVCRRLCWNFELIGLCSGKKYVGKKHILFSFFQSHEHEGYRKGGFILPLRFSMSWGLGL